MLRAPLINHEVQEESDESVESDDDYNFADVPRGSEIDVLPSDIDEILLMMTVRMQ